MKPQEYIEQEQQKNVFKKISAKYVLLGVTTALLTVGGIIIMLPALINVLIIYPWAEDMPWFILYGTPILAEILTVMVLAWAGYIFHKENEESPNES